MPKRFHVHFLMDHFISSTNRIAATSWVQRLHQQLIGEPSNRKAREELLEVSSMILGKYEDISKRFRDEPYLRSPESDIHAVISAMTFVGDLPRLNRAISLLGLQSKEETINVFATTLAKVGVDEIENG